MVSITEFLEARISEDESAAQAAKDWVSNGPEPRFPWFGSPGEVTGNRFGTALPHVAAHSPARVLAECAAKRAMLSKIPKLSDTYDLLGGTSQYVLRCLVAVYQDHPDYEQEWKP